MTNFQIYKKTLSFSLIRFLVDLVSFVILVGLAVLGALLGNKMNAEYGAIVGLIVGLILGAIAMTLITYLVSNRYKAAQIAMMVKGIKEGELPEHTFKEGKEAVKGRFASITLFFFVTNQIKRVFRQLGRTMTGVATAIGGQAGNAVSSTIDSAVQTLIAYLCDCCLGWVFYRQEENAAKAAWEGAAIFFKHGKTLIRNVGRIFGMGLLSLLLIGGAFTGIFYLITMAFVPQFQQLTAILFEDGGVDYHITMIVASGVAALFIWGILHTVLIRPFILTGVLKNFIEAGKEHAPTEAELAEVEKRSPKLARLKEKMQ